MHPTCFVRRTAYEKWGGFDINLRYIMDKDLMARFYSKGANFKYTPNVIVSMSAGGASDANAKKSLKKVLLLRLEMEFQGESLYFVENIKGSD